jgi:serine/threonine-protein kinase RsbW
VTVARQTVDRIFTGYGVRADCRDEIALAVSEACSNAVRHSMGEAPYELEAESQDSECVITVNDAGPGVPADPSTVMPAADAVSGRGMALIRTVTDGVQVRGRRGGGWSVRMFKQLRWSDDALGSLPP